MKSAAAIPLKKSRKRKINVFLREISRKMLPNRITETRAKTKKRRTARTRRIITIRTKTTTRIKTRTTTPRTTRIRAKKIKKAKAKKTRNPEKILWNAEDVKWKKKRRSWQNWKHCKQLKKQQNL